MLPAVDLCVPRTSSCSLSWDEAPQGLTQSHHAVRLLLNRCYRQWDPAYPQPDRQSKVPAASIRSSRSRGRMTFSARTGWGAASSGRTSHLGRGSDGLPLPRTRPLALVLPGSSGPRRRRKCRFLVVPHDGGDLFTRRFEFSRNCNPRCPPIDVFNVPFLRLSQEPARLGPRTSAAGPPISRRRPLAA